MWRTPPGSQGAYVIMAQENQRDSLSNRLAPTPYFGAPPLIYHPCQCRPSAAAPGTTVLGQIG